MLPPPAKMELRKPARRAPGDAGLPPPRRSLSLARMAAPGFSLVFLAAFFSGAAGAAEAARLVRMGRRRRCCEDSASEEEKPP